MKKIFFNLLLFVFGIFAFSNNLFAQGAYVYIDPGFNFKSGSQNFEGFYNYTRVTTSTTTGPSTSSTKYEQINISLGKGFSMGGGFGYMFGKNIGAELGLSYLVGGKNKSKETNTATSPLGTDYYINDVAIYSRMLRINPSLVIEAGCEKITPYAKFGLLIGIGSVRMESNEDDNGDISKIKFKYNGGTALGFNAAAGARFNLSEVMSIFAELCIVNLSYAPTKGKVTDATFNGEDILEDMTTSEKEVEFVKSYTYDSNTPQDDSEPSKQLRRKMPFGSIGINIGFRIGFGKSKQTK